MHLNVDAHDRKSISLFISTGCPRRDRVIGAGERGRCGIGNVVFSDGRAAAARPGPRDLDGQPVIRLRVRGFPAVIRTMGAARVSPAVIRILWGAGVRGSRIGVPWSVEAMGTHTGSTSARSGGACTRCRRRRLWPRPEGLSRQVRSERLEYPVRRCVETALRYAIKTAPDFGGGFGRSKKRLPGPPPPGATPPGVPWGECNPELRSAPTLFGTPM